MHPAPRSCSIAARTASSTPGLGRRGCRTPRATTPIRSPSADPVERADVVVGPGRRSAGGGRGRRRRRCTPSIERGVGDRAGDRAEVVDRQLDREGAGVGDEAVASACARRCRCTRSGSAPSRPGRRRAARSTCPPRRAPRCRWRTRRPSGSGPTGCAPGRCATCELPPEKHRSSHTALPVIVAPAASSRVTTVASRVGTKPSTVAEPFIIGTPATIDVVLDRDRAPGQRAVAAPPVISVVTYQAPSGLSASLGPRATSARGGCGAVRAYSSSTTSQEPSRPVTNGLNSADRRPRAPADSAPPPSGGRCPRVAVQASPPPSPSWEKEGNVSQLASWSTLPRPVPRYPAELPITARRDEILAAIRDHQVVIVAGETGSGKSTQLPKMCLELGRGVAGPDRPHPAPPAGGPGRGRAGRRGARHRGRRRRRLHRPLHRPGGRATRWSR